MRKLIAALVAVACIVPALAVAADPAPNSTFRYCDSRDSCPFGFKTNRAGTKLKQITAYNRCAAVPVEGGYPKIPVNDEGKFSKSGTVTDVTGQKLDFTIKGKFKKPGRAVGTYEIDRKGCNAQPTEFVAKRVEP